MLPVEHADHVCTYRLFPDMLSCVRQVRNQFKLAMIWNVLYAHWASNKLHAAIDKSGVWQHGITVIAQESDTGSTSKPGAYQLGLKHNVQQASELRTGSIREQD